MKYLLRFISFLAKKGVAVLVVIGILVTVFTSAMNMSNMFILVSDGLELRAVTILGKNSGAELNKYFSTDFVENDPLLNESPYAQYTISGASYAISFEWLWAWPWQTTTIATVAERVTLEGEKKKDYITNAEQAAIDAVDANDLIRQEDKSKAKKDVVAAPYWQNARLEVTLRKQANGSWIITRVTRVDDMPDATLRPN